MPHYAIHAAQIQGNRPIQADRYAVRQCGTFTLMLLADGMGDRPCDDSAAQIAVDTMTQCCAEGFSRGGAPAAILEAAALQADQAIHRHAARHPECLGMGTTLVAACVSTESNRLHYAFLGDSLLLRLTPLRIEDLVEPQGDGLLEVAALGVDLRFLQCPAEGIPIQPGDKFLLASDGLESLFYPYIAGMLEVAADPKTAVEQIIAAIGRRRHFYQDNTTLIALYVADDAPAKEPA